MEKRLRLVAYLCLRNTLYYLLFSSYLLTYLLTWRFLLAKRSKSVTIGTESNL